MILCVDVGNTNIVIGAFENTSSDKPIFTSRISTNTKKMPDEYVVILSQLLQIYNCDKTDFEGAIISSVVPPLVTTLKTAINKLINCKIYTISPGVKTGLNIKIDNPAVLGSDLVCAAVGGIKKYKLPLIILDMGTATKFSAVDNNGDFLGVSILPGVTISLDALSKNTAQLPFIDFSDVNVVIGKNTTDSMKSGIIYGSAGMVDGMIDRISEEMNCIPTVVATGGIAKGIIPYCKKDIILDEHLILCGLLTIYKKNNK